MATTETWSDPSRCPYCGATLDSPGAGFVDHLDDADDCERRHGRWRDRIDDDMRGGWAG
jgi:hypothetical protein